MGITETFNTIEPVEKPSESERPLKCCKVDAVARHLLLLLDLASV